MASGFELLLTDLVSQAKQAADATDAQAAFNKWEAADRNDPDLRNKLWCHYEYLTAKEKQIWSARAELIHLLAQERENISAQQLEALAARVIAAVEALSHTVSATSHTVSAALKTLLERSTPVISSTASACSSGFVNKFQSCLQTAYTVSFCVRPPCCLTEDDIHSFRSSAAIPKFKWRSNREDAPSNILKAVQHLQRYILPDGLYAHPVQQVCWLQGSISCGAVGTVVIEPSKADYVILTHQGHVKMTHIKSSRTPRPDDMEDLLVDMVAIYEAKLPAILQNNFRKCRAQAFLQYLAANQLLNKNGRLVVLLGDMNTHHCIHSGGLEKIHCASPPKSMSTIPEGNATTSAPADVTVPFIKAVLKRVHEEIVQQGPSGSGLGDSNTPDDAGGGSQGSGSRGDSGSSSGGGDGGSTVAKGGHWATGGGAEGQGGTVGNSEGESRQLGHCGDGVEAVDEGLAEAYRENEFAQQMSAALNVLYKDLGLPAPPSYTPPTKEVYVGSFRLLPLHQSS